jgi:xylan 1,4-beta-xylosidase
MTSEGEATFLVRAGEAGTAMPRSWEVAVGCGDAWSLLRADLQEQLRRAVRECGFRYLRCHGILCDQLQVVQRDREGRIVYNWQLVDTAYDALLAVGLRPFVELGFMPAALASGDQAVFFYRANVTPPADYDAWCAFIDALVRHWLARYGEEEVRSWFFEVWNEANLRGFWSSTRDEYFKLYEATARTIKAVDPALRVGGPASTKAEWLPEFLGFCRERGVPVDFASTHVYPDDDDFEKVDPGYRALFNRGGYLEKVVHGATAQVAEARPAGGATLPLHWTEWNSSWRWGRPIHDAPNQAAYICKAIHAIYREVDSFAFWTISDIFNEFPYPRATFVGGFGLLTVDGVPKPGYHAYQLLHRLGEHELPAERLDGGAGDERLGTLDLWATRRGAALQLLLANYTPPGLEGEQLPDRAVNLRLLGLAPGIALRATEYRVDATHANGLAAWQALGHPDSPTPQEIAALRQVADLQSPGTLTLEVDAGGEALLRSVLPPGSVAFYELAEGA